MGIIDKKIIKLICKNCNVVEEKRILDKGTAMGGSFWQDAPKFEHFNTTWSERSSYREEPMLLEALCKNCGAAAESTSDYSL